MGRLHGTIGCKTDGRSRVMRPLWDTSMLAVGRERETVAADGAPRPQQAIERSPRRRRQPSCDERQCFHVCTEGHGENGSAEKERIVRLETG